MKTAFLFPGQNSQSVGMGRDLIEGSETAHRMFAAASTITGYNVAELCVGGPKERLDTTLYTQPAIYTLSCAAATLLAERGVLPDVVAGHSVGEYAALHSAGVFSFERGLTIICERANLMYTAGGGRMVAVVGMEPAAVEQALADLPREQAGIGLYNAPGQVVISGTEAGVALAEERLRAAGARRLVPLAVSGAFHSELMRPVRDRFAAVLEAHPFQPPRVPYISNLTGEVMEDPGQIRAALANLLISPVRWMQSVERLVTLGVERCLEVGPGTVLRGLVKQICKELPCSGAGTMAEIMSLSAGSPGRAN